MYITHQISINKRKKKEGDTAELNKKVFVANKDSVDELDSLSSLGSSTFSVTISSCSEKLSGENKCSTGQGSSDGYHTSSVTETQLGKGKRKKHLNVHYRYGPIYPTKIQETDGSNLFDRKSKKRKIGPLPETSIYDTPTNSTRFLSSNLYIIEDFAKNELLTKKPASSTTGKTELVSFTPSELNIKSNRKSYITTIKMKPVLSKCLSDTYVALNYEGVNKGKIPFVDRYKMNDYNFISEEGVQGSKSKDIGTNVIPFDFIDDKFDSKNMKNSKDVAISCELSPTNLIKKALHFTKETSKLKDSSSRDFKSFADSDQLYDVLFNHFSSTKDPLIKSSDESNTTLVETQNTNTVDPVSAQKQQIKINEIKNLLKKEQRKQRRKAIESASPLVPPFRTNIKNNLENIDLPIKSIFKGQRNTAVTTIFKGERRTPPNDLNEISRLYDVQPIDPLNTRCSQHTQEICSANSNNATKQIFSNWKKAEQYVLYEYNQYVPHNEVLKSCTNNQDYFLEQSTIKSEKLVTEQFTEDFLTDLDLDHFFTEQQKCTKKVPCEVPLLMKEPVDSLVSSGQVKLIDLGRKRFILKINNGDNDCIDFPFAVEDSDH